MDHPSNFQSNIIADYSPWPNVFLFPLRPGFFEEIRSDNLPFSDPSIFQQPSEEQGPFWDLPPTDADPETSRMPGSPLLPSETPLSTKAIDQTGTISPPATQAVTPSLATATETPIITASPTPEGSVQPTQSSTPGLYPTPSMTVTSTPTFTPIPTHTATPTNPSSSFPETTHQNAIYFATRGHTHFVNGHYWVAFYDGQAAVLYSSSDGQNWTSQGRIFTSNDFKRVDSWGLTFEGSKVHAASSTWSSGLQYRQGDLRNDGTINWGSEANIHNGGDYGTGAGHTDSSGLPWIWDGDQEIDFYRCTQTDGQGSWDKYEYMYTKWSGNTNKKVFPAPDAAGDMVSILPFFHEYDLRAITYAHSSNSWGPPITIATDVKGYDDHHLRIDSVQLSNGEIHLVIIDRDGQIDHYKRSATSPYNWSMVSSNVTGLTSHERVALTAAGTKLWIFYDKGDNGIYYRNYRPSGWSNEYVLKSANAVTIHGAISTYETARNNEVGIVWVEGNSTPYTVRFIKISAVLP